MVPVRCRFVDVENAVGRAIQSLGGLTEATVKTGVASSTWSRWRKKGWIEDPHVLLEAARLTGIDPHELAKPSKRSAQG